MFAHYETNVSNKTIKLQLSREKPKSFFVQKMCSEQIFIVVDM